MFEEVSEVNTFAENQPDFKSKDDHEEMIIAN